MLGIFGRGVRGRGRRDGDAARRGDGAEQRIERPHVHQGHRADPVRLVRGLPPGRRDGADGADDVRRGAALGPVDQEPRGRAGDAALAHRQEHRHPGLQGRHLAERRADRRHRGLGGRRRADGRPGRPAGDARVPGLVGVADRRAGSGRALSGLPGAGRGTRPVRLALRPVRPGGGSLHQGDPDAARQRAVTQGGPPRALLRRGPRLRRPDERRHAGPGRVPGGVRLRQGRRDLPGGLRQAAAGGQEGAGQLSPALHRRARGGRYRARHRVPPRGRGAQVHPVVEAARPAQHRPGHPGRRGRSPGRLRAAAVSREDHGVPAAHAHPRQVPVPGADLPDHADQQRDRQLRALRLQLAPGLQLRRRCGPPGAGGDDPAHHKLARQHGRPTGPIRIRTTGPATAAARSTRWASPGSAGTI